VMNGVGNTQGNIFGSLNAVAGLGSALMDMWGTYQQNKINKRQIALQEQAYRDQRADIERENARLDKVRANTQKAYSGGGAISSGNSVVRS